MALNWINPTADHTPAPLPEERFFLTAATADVELRIPPTTAGPKRTEKGFGTVWITDRRLIFLAEREGQDKPTTAPPASFQSISIPYHLVSSADFKQGIFSSNALVISFRPVQGESSNLPDPGRDQSLELKITLRDGQLWEVRQKLEEARAGDYERRKRDAQGENLPAYHKTYTLSV